jgi:hypothetical protein
LAVDPNAPAVVDVIRGLLSALPLDELEAVQILLGEETNAELLAAVQTAVPESVGVLIHRPDEQEQLGYLAATELGDPIYLNRVLLDAGIVIPVMSARPSVVLDVGSAGGGVYPWLADRQSQLRVTHGLTGDDQARADAIREAEGVAWQLGIQLELQVLPSVEGGVAEVACGTANRLQAHWSARLASQWGDAADAPPDLVVACLPGEPQQQTWENVARAAFAAAQLVRPGGTIAVCSELSEDPPPALLQLGAAESVGRVAAKLDSDRSRYALTASALWHTSTQGRLLLLSRLHRETVEELGFGALEHISELQRLIDQHKRCLVMNAAQYGGVAAEEVA